MSNESIAASRGFCLSSNIAEGKGVHRTRSLYFSYTMPEAHFLKSRPSCSSLKD